MTTKSFDRLRTADDVRTLYIHAQAAETIGNMFAQLEKIKATFGAHESYYQAASSLNHCLANLLRTGFSNEAYVTRENDDIGLSLFVQEGDTFVFGIIWFPDRAYDESPHRGIAGGWSCHS